jgi:hypothetical protein
MNWGTKIIIGMSIFIVFILAMGAKMIMSNQNDDLVDKDYYEKGLTYSEEYDKKVSAARDGVIPTIEGSEQGISVTFVSIAKYRIDCKYVSDSESDRVFKGQTGDNYTVDIPMEHLRRGAWRVKIEYVSNAKEYQFEQEIVMP